MFAHSPSICPAFSDLYQPRLRCFTSLHALTIGSRQFGAQPRDSSPVLLMLLLL